MEQVSFASLPAHVQDHIREQQRQKKLAKRQARASKCEDEEQAERQLPPGSSALEHPSRITRKEYFAACKGLRCNLRPRATEKNLEALLEALSADDPEARQLSTFNYFPFSGSESAVWDPTFNARLLYEGFFTITSGNRYGHRELLPELQPFYGVLTWPNFEASKHVRKALSRIQKSECRYLLANSSDPTRSWRSLNDYHLQKYGSNWLTERYFEMLRRASNNSDINFSLHCIELYLEAEDTKPLAGEIGFSIGRVYTSLSGWTGERTSEGLGFMQLVLLGRWLQQRGYCFWSLGHCYSPEMDYKRELGHRIYPRADFLSLLKLHRGAFRHREGNSLRDSLLQVLWSLKRQPSPDEEQTYRHFAGGDRCQVQELLEKTSGQSDAPAPPEDVQQCMPQM